jgi:integrase
MKHDRGDGYLYQRGGTWWAQYYVKQGSVSKRVRRSCETADRKKAEKFLKLRTAEARIGTHRDVSRIPYEHLRDKLYDNYRTYKMKSLCWRQDESGQPTIPYLDSVVRLDTFFEGYEVRDIDVGLIEKFMLHERNRGKSNASINRSLAALSRMFTLAKKRGEVQSVPAFPERLPEAKARQGFVEKAEYDRVFAVTAEPKLKHLRVPLALGFFTGMRKSEMLNLRWNQVDFLENEIMLLEGETKNDDPRTIPMVPDLRQLLEDCYRHRPQGAVGDYVCVRESNGKVARLGHFDKAWKTACTKAGKPGLLLHDLRRSAVRNLIRAGVPQSVAMVITGHKTANVFERYNITAKTDRQLAAEKLAAYLAPENSHISATIEGSTRPGKSLTH